MAKKEPTFIKASEIAQYTYCSVAWDLERKSAKLDITRLDLGTELHVDVGMHIRSLPELKKSARRLAFLGFVLLILSVVLGIWWSL